MGCTNSKTTKAYSTIKRLEKHEKPVADSELNESKQLFDRIQTKKSFACQLTGLTTLHNHICLVREKKEALSLLVFDLSQDSKGPSTKATKESGQNGNIDLDDQQSINSIAFADSELGLYRCRKLDLDSVLLTDQSTSEFVQMVYFKYVFFVGLSETNLQRSPQIVKFLQFILTNDKLNPFCFYFVKSTASCQEIEQTGYKHLCIQSKLPQFPNIMLKPTDFDKSAKGKKNKLFLTSTGSAVKKEQLEQLGIKKIILMDNSERMIKSKLESDFKGITLQYIELDQFQDLCQQGDYNGALGFLSKKTLPALKSSFGSSTCIMAGDPDSTSIIALAQFMQSQDKKFTIQKALALLKNRRAQSNPLRQFVEIMQGQEMAKNVAVQIIQKASNDPAQQSRKQVIQSEFKDMRVNKMQVEACYELLDLLLKNIIDKEPAETTPENNIDLNKCRSVKQSNQKISTVITKTKQGQNLMQLVGFEKKGSGAEAVWQCSGSISWVKGVRLDLQAGFSAFVSANEKK